MPRYYSNTAVPTALVADVTAADSTITVGSTSGFPVQRPYTLSIDADTGSKELVEVTAASGTVLTVTRGVDGTSAVAHSAGAKVSHDHSARDFREAQDHFAASSNVHGVAGSVVGTTSTQTLTNKTLEQPTLMYPTLNTATINVANFTGAVTGLSKTTVGLGNADNTSDLNKPISTATAAALSNKADKTALPEWRMGTISVVFNNERSKVGSATFSTPFPSGVTVLAVADFSSAPAGGTVYYVGQVQATTTGVTVQVVSRDADTAPVTGTFVLTYFASLER